MASNTWRKSSYSGGQGGDCVEVKSDVDVMVRDTKDNGTGPVLGFSASSWTAFLSSI